MTSDLCELTDVRVLEIKPQYVLIETVNKGELVKAWIRKSKVLGGWSMRKDQKYRTVAMLRQTAENKGLLN